MNFKISLLAVGALTVCLATRAHAQAIKVVVNGDPVAFGNQGPITVYGHVMIPFRAVIEKLGASVSWDDARKVILAKRGSTEVRVLVGTSVAQINGEDVDMDVMSRMVNGTAYVPLRFVGEALGADILWVSKTQTVQIESSDAPAVNAETLPKPPPPSPSIGAFSSNQTGFIGAGVPLKFTLRAASGASASFHIPGATGELPMVEESEGVYAGLWATPAGKSNSMSLNRAAVIAVLQTGSDSTYYQLGGQISIDTIPPEMGDFLPEPDTRFMGDRPYVSLSFDDGTGSGVDPKSVQVTLDGKDVASLATIDYRGLSFRPAYPLDPGRHEVSVLATDRAGNISASNWGFTTTDQPDHIRGIAYSGASLVEAGGTIKVLLVGDPDCKVEFSIGSQVVDQPMVETAPGEYSGEYTVDPADDFANDVITAKLKSDTGDTFTAQAPDRVSTKASTPAAPKLLSPLATAPPVTPVIITGNATPFARVRVKIDFSATPDGGLRLSGPLAETVVDADQNGDFETFPLELDSFLNSLKATYTITAEVLGRKGQVSLPATVSLVPAASNSKAPK